MQEWMKVTAAALPVALLLILIIIFLRRFCSFKGGRDFTETARVRAETLQSGVSELNNKNLVTFQHQNHDLDGKRRPNYYVFRRGMISKPLFNWADHPSLVSEAVEYGWSRFAFTGFMASSSSTRSVLLGLCSSGDQERETEMEMKWEVCPGSADFMQQIRVNSGLKKVNLGYPPCVIKSALPLPGPPLENSSFPEEAYFEITILSSPEYEDRERKSESERTKLISENSDAKGKSDSLIHVTSINGNNKLEGLKLGSKKEVSGEAMMLSLGFTSSGSPLKLPGSYLGSIGFNSNGSVYLDGIKLVFESEKSEWGSKNTVIGCGFDPNLKKVFFTVNSELVHLINCKSEEFGSPLYPTLASNMDVTILVNFGQSEFVYEPANSQRTPNPCFISPFSNSPASALGYEDSRELFSMGRIDSEWLNRSATKNNFNGGSVVLDVDAESEADLFEIVLDNGTRSTSTKV